MILARLIAIRAEPGLSETIDRASEMGLDIWGEPLFDAQPCPWDSAEISHCNAILAGSANVFRYGGDGLDRLKHLPVHAVGSATADIARAQGFTVNQIGGAGLQDILDRPENAGVHYARLMARDHTQILPAHGQMVSEVVTYEMIALPAPLALLHKCSQGGLVLLHSARSARHFAHEIDLSTIARDQIGLAALSPQILNMAGEGWKTQMAAPRPTDDALLDIAAEYLNA